MVDVNCMGRVKEIQRKRKTLMEARTRPNDHPRSSTRTEKRRLIDLYYFFYLSRNHRRYRK